MKMKILILYALCLQVVTSTALGADFESLKEGQKVVFNAYRHFYEKSGAGTIDGRFSLGTIKSKYEGNWFYSKSVTITDLEGNDAMLDSDNLNLIFPGEGCLSSELCVNNTGYYVEEDNFSLFESGQLDRGSMYVESGRIVGFDPDTSAILLARERNQLEIVKGKFRRIEVREREKCDSSGYCIDHTVYTPAKTRVHAQVGNRIICIRTKETVYPIILAHESGRYRDLYLTSPRCSPMFNDSSTSCDQKYVSACGGDLIYVAKNRGGGGVEAFLSMLRGAHADGFFAVTQQETLGFYEMTNLGYTSGCINQRMCVGDTVKVREKEHPNGQSAELKVIAIFPHRNSIALDRFDYKLHQGLPPVEVPELFDLSKHSVRQDRPGVWIEE